MSAVALILRVKYRLFDNHVRSIRRHLIFHLLVGLGVIAIIWGGGLALFSWLFEFLKEQEPFGPPLIDRLMSMVMMAFFSMLIFSNLIVTLSTTYVSREVAYFMSLPLSMGQIFWAKLIESTVYSSWAFAMLSLPAFVAYGRVLGAGEFAFYPALALLLIPFIAIPAGIGAMLTMAISAFVPARRARTLALILGVLSAALTVILMRVMGGRALGGSLDDEFSALMNMLSFGATPILPNVWLTRGMQAAARGEWLDYGYWLAMLCSNGLVVATACAWMVGPLYYRGWALARDSASGGGVGPGGSFFDRLDRLYAFLPSSARALVGKDIRIFWRDPVQWSQLLILFGLLVIYIYNIQAHTPPVETSSDLWNLWRARLSFFNIGAVCFILSILTTRFVYPMLSLEGREFWVIGLAPMRRETLVWQKYWLCWLSSIALSISIMTLSCIALEVSPAIFALSLVTIVILSFGLTSLSVGLGALTPNFQEDNPARIANGLGGTMNVILSVLYVGLTLGLEGALFLRFELSRSWDLSQFNPHAWAALAVLLALQIVVIFLPMRLGLRRWNAMEF